MLAFKENGMVPGTHDITVMRGEDFSLTFQVLINSVVLDLTGATAYAQVRAKENDRTSTLLGDFTTAIDASHYVTITLADTVSAAVTADEGWYDVLIVDSTGADTYYLRGKVTFIGSATVKA